MSGRRFDVLVIGEVLVELSSQEPLADGASLRLGFSGDALNVAAASAAAGARTALLARIPDDELGDAMVARIGELGVVTTKLIRSQGQHGLYLSHADPDGERQFVYVRKGSAGSQLDAGDVSEQLVESAEVVVASGVACAISESAAAAVLKAARLAERFIYDPNFRPRLTTAAAAATALRAAAPLAELVTPSWPGEARALLDLTREATDREALQALRELGACGVLLTRGAQGALVDTGTEVTEIPAVRAPRVVDQTGAGDVMTGTVAARLALGDSLLEAVRLGAAAASLSVQGQGGTGYLPSLEETRSVAQTPLGMKGQ